MSLSGNDGVRGQPGTGAISREYFGTKALRGRRTIFDGPQTRTNWGALRVVPCLACLFSLLVLPGRIGEAAGAERVDFSAQVRPLLANRCFRCHGPDEDTLEAGLRLDLPETATAEADSGSVAIVPNKPEESELIARVTSTDEDLRMPPAEAGEALSADELVLLTRWIAEGADYQQHWSFVPIRRPALPKLDTKRVAHPVDRFIISRLESEGLRPAPAADKATLIRRLSLDLTGLPPSIAEADRFVTDERADAYERLVDRLLASPAYGERWARVWLDLARYADSAGYAQDPPRTIWRYRDWAIQAFNSNMPFDQFTILQFAGDLLPHPTTDQLIATAFHRNTMTNSEGGTDDEEFRNAAIIDRVNTTMEVWMGLTMGCAQCHNHKYDPITQEEYYRFFAVLNNTADADRGDEQPFIEELSSVQQAKKRALREQIAQLEKTNGDQDQQDNSASDESRQANDTAKQQLAELKKELDGIQGVRTPVMRELPEDQRRETYIQVRGNFRVKGAQVQPGAPAAFHPIGDDPDRMALARWLVDPDNPLTARVVANRFWEQLFGRGIVVTSEDFGTQGELPSHPELLDYLAAELIRHEWDTKWLVRQIVTSGTYRQSSRVTPELREHDAENRLLARGPRFRLSAEMIRDQALAIGGLLSNKMHGPSVLPPQPKLGLRAAFGGSTDWEASEGEDRYRRGLYTSWRRTTPYPSMTTFDAPSREVCTVRRIRTNTPLQALVTLNDPVFIESAQAMARRIDRVPDRDVRQRAKYAFRLVLTREPTASETDRVVELFEATRVLYVSQPAQAKAMATEPLGPAPSGADLAELAAWTVVSNVLLNLDETLARP